MEKRVLEVYEGERGVIDGWKRQRKRGRERKEKKYDGREIGEDNRGRERGECEVVREKGRQRRENGDQREKKRGEREGE